MEAKTAHKEPVQNQQYDIKVRARWPRRPPRTPRRRERDPSGGTQSCAQGAGASGVAGTVETHGMGGKSMSSVPTSHHAPVGSDANRSNTDEQGSNLGNGGARRSCGPPSGSGCNSGCGGVLESDSNARSNGDGGGGCPAVPISADTHVGSSALKTDEGGSESAHSGAHNCTSVGSGASSSGAHIGRIDEALGWVDCCSTTDGSGAHNCASAGSGASSSGAHSTGAKQALLPALRDM